MKAKRIATFEELMDTRYGVDCARPRRFSADFDSLLAGYYGAAPPPPMKDKAIKPAIDVDPGTEVLQQSLKPVSRMFSRGQSMPPAEPRLPTDGPGLIDEERVRQERLLDLCAQPGPMPDMQAPPPVETPPPQMQGGPAPQPQQPVSLPPDAPMPQPSKAASEDEFLADMKAIMSGQKMYDPMSKTLTDRHAVAKPPEARDQPMAQPASLPPPQVPPPGGGHDIFERIARSMEHAGAYDLGQMDLENRFAHFDQKATDVRPPTLGEGGAPKMPPIEIPPIPAMPDVNARLEEIRSDLKDITQPTIPEVELPKTDDYFPQPSETLWTGQPDYAEPLYASGEHYRAGDGLYPNALVVGQKPGMAFSYGHIITMADLFDTPDQMMSATVDELGKIKGLLNADIAHYAPGGSSKPAPGSGQWEWATGGRYLRLAEDNYEHFAPNILFRDAKFISSVSKHGDHKSAWEKYHLRALREVAALGPTLDPQLTHHHSPLIVNAFGDHFLTDAFSSGHVISKPAIMDLFKANFYSGGKLSKAGETFMGTVASLAFKGKLKEKFSVLETYDPKFLWWNPNIDTVNAFTQLLIGIANQEPDKISNLAVKALHDKLNKEGIEVSNGLGAAPWKLTGDGYLTETTLKVMQAAVKQSVANLLDPAVRKPGFDPTPYLALVWRNVPVLTQKSLDYLRAQVPNFINPNSVWLSGAAAEILHNEVDTLIKELITRKILKPA